MTSASICTIGDEILIGQIVDTNSSHISRELQDIGVRVRRMLSIGDNRQEILDNLTAELSASDIVIVTGGLGPTKDDITKSALAELSGSSSWVEHPGQMEMIVSILHSRGLDVLETNRAQAMVPDTCEVIVNRRGTAPIMAFHFPEERFGHKASLYALPGVPFEAVAALPDVIRDIKSHHATSDISHRSVMTFGIAESALSELISDWEDSLPQGLHLAYLPNSLTGVKLRLSAYGGNKEEQEARIGEQIAKLRPILGTKLYSESEGSLELEVGALLKKSGKTMCSAESCTGGKIASLITSVPGSSEYYLGSVISYANSVKENVLGVSTEIIDKYGAVSSDCVAAMAEGVRRLTGADFSVATSGIAGPGGGSDEKPVGLVWIGVSSAAGTVTEKFIYKNDRLRNIERFTATALDLLRQKILIEI